MPVKVEIVHSFPADDAPRCEAYLHQMYDPWRVNGEWFELPGGQVTMIKFYRGYENGQLKANPDEVPDLLDEIAHLPPGEYQPHPSVKEAMKKSQRKREEALRELASPPVSKDDLRRILAHAKAIHAELK